MEFETSLRGERRLPASVPPPPDARMCSSAPAKDDNSSTSFDEVIADPDRMVEGSAKPLIKQMLASQSR